MSKIDLSKAKIGDKFRTRNGGVVTYKGTDGRIAKSRSDYYVCACSGDAKITYFKNGVLLLDEEHPYDLVEQVFDDDKMEREIKSQKEMQEAVGIEDEAELQRRQEVVELAEKMYIMFENETLRCYLSCNDTYCSEDLVEMTFIRAAFFVNKKHKYLKEGKL